jgi:uncharacterized SAM-binding protein YcdF (DUF218 family)
MIRMTKKRLLNIFIVLAALPASAYFFTAIITGVYVYKDNAVQSDAIIVLGAKAYQEDGFNPCLEARVDHAVELYDQGLAPFIIMSGGDDAPGGPNEALAMKEMAMKRGVTGEDILLEQKSTSTYENIKFSKSLMEQNNLSTAIIVTEKFHNYRADVVASELLVPHTLSPTSSPCWDRWKFFSRYFLREPIALIYYKVSGRL